MKTKLNRILSILLVFALVCSTIVFSASAAEDFTWSAYDKGYVTLVFDDGKMPITEEAAQLFEEYDMPMSAAIPAKLVEYGNDLYNALVKIQNNGGEILSHGYDHIPIVDTSNPEYANATNNAGKYIDTSKSTAADEIDYQLGESWRKLNNLGFKVNGMIQVGCGGAEGTADYDMVENIARKYYKYSDSSGVSAQYKISRRSTSWDTMENLKKRIDSAATNKSWVVLYAHTFKEISRDAGTEDSSALREVLQHIKETNGAVEVVTYNDMYEKFGNYTGDAVPTQESIATLDPKVTKDYYVKSMGYEALNAGKYDASKINGSGNSDYAVGTKENPAATVLDVIKAINAEGLSVGDTANVYIMQRDDWNVYDNTAIGHEEVDGSNVFYIPHHNMTAWAHSTVRDDNKVPEAHAWTMVLKADTSSTTDDGKVYLTYGDRLGTNHSMQLGGPTVFDDVTVVTMRRSLDRAVMFNGNDVTFESGVTYGYLNIDYADKGTSRKVWDGTVTSYKSLAHQLIKDKISGTFGGMTVNMNNPYVTSYNAKFYVVAPSSDNSKTVTFTDDVTININNSSANPTMIFGVSSATSKVEFDNLNIKLKAGKITTTAVTTGVMTANAVQAILEKDTTATNLESNISALGITNYYLLTNATSHKDVIDFTSTGGVFKVADGYVVTATHSDGTTVKSDGTRLKLTKPGAYTYSINVTKDYYVKSMGYEELDAKKYDATKINGSGDSAYAIGTKQNPAATVLDVIAAINDDGLGEGDVANVYIMQRDDWNEYDGSKIGKNADGTFAIPHHNMTAWAHSETRDDNQKPEAHKWTMVVKGDTSSATDSGRVYLTYGDRLGSNHSLNVSGPTVFENVTITMMRSSRDRAVYFNNNDVSFANSCTYGYINNSYHTTSLAVWDKTVRTSATFSLPNGLIAEGVSTAQGSMTVNMENTYTSNVYVASSSAGSNRTVNFTGDININLNNSAATAKLLWGVNGSTSSPPKNTKHNLKNVNIHISDGKLSNEAVVRDASNVITANAVQAIVENGASIVDLDTTLTTLGISNYYVLNNTGDRGLLDFVRDADGNSVAGQFTVSGDTTAVAANSEGAVVAVSSNGLLKITTPGVYEIRFINAFDNDGRTLTVYEPGKIDLSAIEHDEIEGKVFIGWAFSNGTYPNKDYEYKYGDVITAQYVDITSEDFKTEEVQVRDDGFEGDPALRFVQSLKKGLLPNITERGTLMLPLSQSYGYEMFIDEPVIYTYTANKEITDFNINATGATPIKILGTNTLVETEDAVKYTLCLTGITKENYTTSYAVRGYIKFKDNNGFDSVFYADQEVSSLYKAAAESSEQTATEKAIVEYVDTERVENYWTNNGLTADGKITASTTAQYVDGGCGCFGEDTCDHKLFTLNNGKLYVRDVILDTGLNIEETQIGFITDTHFNSVNEMDLAENSVALSSYRGRPESWRNHQRQYFTHGINDFASMFKKTVNGGDVMDFLSWGAVQSADRIFTKQSVSNLPVKKFVANELGEFSLQNAVSGNMGMVMGNHDPKQLSSPVDNSLKEMRTIEERYAMAQAHWTNDVYYDSEIMLDSNGKENIMMIYIDNSQHKYLESQIAPLTRDLAYAKSHGIPALIFQHIPMLSMNPNETEWKYLDGFHNYNKIVPQDNSYYDTANGKYTIKEGHIGAGTQVKVINMTNASDYMGDASSDEATLTMCQLIRKNADVIKGVFAGHIHAHTKSEIIAIDENGDPNGLTIPQYTGYLASQRGVMRITVK